MKYDFKVNEINKRDAVIFLQEFHYSPVFPVLTKHYLGIYNEYNLVGVLTLGWGTQPMGTIKKLFPDDNMTTNDYYEIGKMAMDEIMPRNSESQMLRAVIRWAKEYLPEKKFIYTMADGIQGKVGYVYQASNFLYGGKYYTDVYLTDTGEKVHPRSMNMLLKDNAKYLGKEKLFWMTPEYMSKIGMCRVRGYMFRYMYPLTKKARKILIRNGWNIDFPKENTLLWKKQVTKGRYDFIKKPSFCFDNAVINKKNIEQNLKDKLWHKRSP